MSSHLIHSFDKPQVIHIEENAHGQRIDNYLLRVLVGVPKSRIYRILRKGEVRVNGGRKKPTYRLQADDQLRLPPIRLSEINEINVPIAAYERLMDCIIEDNDAFLVLNKPSGVAVHSGSGVAFGVIETIKAHHADSRHWELVHRLDRETSGCLLIAKSRESLNALQDLFRARSIQKKYQALLFKRMPKQTIRMEQALRKTYISGEHMVVVEADGKPAVSIFECGQTYSLPSPANNVTASLADVSIETGRTHQIRVHAKTMGQVIAGDEKYGDSQFNQQCKALGLKRLFLHAAHLSFDLNAQHYEFYAPLPEDLQGVLSKLIKTEI